MSIRRRRRGTAIVETDKGILVTAGRSKIFITPGGGAGRKESRMQASIRELKEETGLEPYFAMALFKFEGKVHQTYNFQDLHTVYLIKAHGTAEPKHEVKYVAHYKPGCDLRLSSTTKKIIDEYLLYKEKNKEIFNIIDRL